MDNETIQLKTDALALQEKASEVCVIENTDQEARAVEFLVQTKKRYKIVETKFKEYTAPLKETIKTIKADFDSILDPLTEAERIVKNGIRTFRDSEDFRLKEEQRKVLEMAAQEAIRDVADNLTDETLQIAQEASQAVVEANVEAPKTVNVQSGQARYRKDWKFEVVDPDLVPRNLCVPDSKLIRESIKMGTREIEGIKIWEETTPIIMS